LLPLANISPPHRFLLILIQPLQSAHPANSKKSQLILFLIPVSPTLIADVSLFDLILISGSIDAAFLNPADTSINQKVRLWLTRTTFLITHHALPSPSSIPKY
jgi:hypothetical protein